MRILRWILLIPAALAASFISHFFAVFAQGLINGFNTTAEFWAATDMHDAWMSGTLAIICVRGTSGAFSTWIASRVAPSNRAVAARVWFGVLAAAIVTMIVFAVMRGVPEDGIGFWYRSVLELVAILGGSALILLDHED